MLSPRKRLLLTTFTPDAVSVPGSCSRSPAVFSYPAISDPSWVCLPDKRRDLRKCSSTLVLILFSWSCPISPKHQVFWRSSFCLSDCPSVTLDRDPRLNGSRYKNIFHTVRQGDVSSFIEAEFRSLEFCGSFRTSVLDRGIPLSKAKIRPITWKRCELGCKLVLFTSIARGLLIGFKIGDLKTDK